MLNGITTHAPTDGADQSDEGSSGKNWFGTVNRLHYLFRPSRPSFWERVPIALSTITKNRFCHRVPPHRLRQTFRSDIGKMYVLGQ